MNESRRWLRRIGSNYVGLFCKLAIGIILTRVLLVTMGKEAFGLISLFGTTVGVGLMITDIVRQSMIRELGVVYHSDLPKLPHVITGAFWLSAAAAGLTAAIYLLMWALVPNMSISPELISVARWFIIANLIQSCIVVGFAPLYNLIIATERMVWLNLLYILDRFLQLAAATLLLLIDTGPVNPLIFYGFLTTFTSGSIVILASLTLIYNCPELRPKRDGQSLRHAKDILSACYWNTVTLTSSNSHIRTDSFIINATHGLTGNLVFGIAVQFTSWCRMVAVGMTNGLNAVSTRISTNNQSERMTWLIVQSTRSHALVVLPVAVLVWVLCPGLLELWIGDQLRSDPALMGMTVLIIQVLIIGISIRAMSDPWVHILYGAGKIRSYVKPLVIAAIMNPLLAIALGRVLPQSISYLATAIALSIVYALFHGLWVGWILIRVMEQTPGKIIGAMVRPLLCALLSLVPVAVALEVGPTGFVFRLGAMLVFVLLFAVLSWRGVLAPQERDRVARMLGLKRRGGSQKS